MFSLRPFRAASPKPSHAEVTAEDATTQVFRFKKGMGRLERASEIGLLACAFAPAAAMAAPAPQIVSADFSGSGCSAADSAYVLDQRTGDFEVRFSNLFASAPVAGEDTRDCEVSVKVKPPQGFALSIAGATLEGAVRFGTDGFAEVTHGYSIRRTDGEFSGLEDTWSTFDDDANVTAGPDVQPFEQKFGPGFGDDPDSIPADWMGGCGALTEIKGSLFLKASSGAAGGTEIFADRSRVNARAPGSKKGRLAWDWVLVPCRGGGNNDGAKLDGRWIFQYQAPNGRTLNGRMTLAGEGGTYKPNGASWTGKISSLRSDGGDVIGSWEALGSKGWVRFSPSSDNRSFTGEWGYQGAAAVGFWNGERE